ncbi:MAG TPA: helix-turn-helix domain-containing protein [Candidatus Binatia bacterium]|jgi:AcrR family transcriptional regulator
MDALISEPDEPVAAVPGRRERRKLEVRRRMVEAAEALFEERGVHATTVAEICDRADVAHKTFFNHFPAKQDLVRAMADASMEILLGEIDRARRHGRDTRERLVLFFESVAERARAAGPMHRELLAEIIHAAQHADDEPANARRLHAAFSAIVRDGVAAREVTARHPAETLTDTILGTYYALMFNWANLEAYPIVERARSAAAFLADALAAGAASASEPPAVPLRAVAGRSRQRQERERRDGKA